MRSAKTIHTIGHSTRAIEDLVAMLQAHGIRALADVRTIPRSRRHPQFNADSLAETLQRAAVEYVPMKSLGGLRKPLPDSLNTAWRNDIFRGYADYMQTPEFEAAVTGLETLARSASTAIMCAEAVPWRCHRSLIADALTARGWTVLHIMSATQAMPHKLTESARVTDHHITYPAPSLFAKSD